MAVWEKAKDEWWYEDLIEAFEEIGFDSFANTLREYSEDVDWVMSVGHEVSGEWLSEWIDEYREDYYDPDDPRHVRLLEVLEIFWATEWSDQEE